MTQTDQNWKKRFDEFCKTLVPGLATPEEYVPFIQSELSAAVHLAVQSNNELSYANGIEFGTEQERERIIKLLEGMKATDIEGNSYYSKQDLHYIKEGFNVAIDQAIKMIKEME